MDIDGEDQLGRGRWRVGVLGGWVGAGDEEGEGVGEEGAGTVGEGGDEVTDTWVVSGRPSGEADVFPEAFLGGERVQLRGDAAGGGERWAVEAGEDVCLKNVGMDGVD